jgi:D-alanyl-D-alanine carboxypeptidase (penicillin-binding protein 5/6)
MKYKRTMAMLLIFALILSWCPAVMADNDDLSLDCQGAILIDAQTGKVLYEHNANVKWYPASMTKIMTLILALEAVRDGKASLEEQVTASEYACSFGGTQVWLEPGEKFSLEQMLIGIAVGSANDCSVADLDGDGGFGEAPARGGGGGARDTRKRMYGSTGDGFGSVIREPHCHAVSKGRARRSARL